MEGLSVHGGVSEAMGGFLRKKEMEFDIFFSKFTFKQGQGGCSASIRMKTGVPLRRLQTRDESLTGACQCRRHKKSGFDLWIRNIPWRRAWQPTPVFLSGQSQGQRSLEGYNTVHGVSKSQT